MFLTEYNEQKTMAAFMEEGEEKGEIKGTLRTLLGLVKKGLLTLAQAAEETHMTEDEFNAKIAELGLS